LRDMYCENEKSLMLGDYIAYAGTNYRISRLCNRKGSAYEPTCVVALDREDGEQIYLRKYEIKGLEPIPLTPDMLKANEWKHLEKGEGQICYGAHWEYDDEPGLYLEEDEGGALSIDVGGYQRIIPDVQSLQHLMRLLGFHGLADNFKI
jgi:hypothetical protein